MLSRLKFRCRRVFLLGSVAMWIAAIAAGMVCLAKYDATPGSTGRIAHRWPAGTGVARAAGRPQLVMFAHPRCPCTRASIGELARLMTDCRGLVAAQVLFIKPHETEPDWEQTDLWRRAAEIPGVQVAVDEGGRASHAFGTETSGHVLLYGARGELQFSGGITASRGHSGDNAGRSAITSLLRMNDRTVPALQCSRTLVFGCPLCRPRGNRSGKPIP
jgi:hypothetical protein